jgi:hypothetical protein
MLRRGVLEYVDTSAENHECSWVLRGNVGTDIY